MKDFSISSKIYDSNDEFINALYEGYKDDIDSISTIIGEQINVSDLHIILERNNSNNYPITFTLDGMSEDDLQSEMNLALKYMNINRVVFGFALFEDDVTVKIKDKTLCILRRNYFNISNSIKEVVEHLDSIVKDIGDTGETSKINGLTNEFNDMSNVFEMLLTLNIIEAYKANLTGHYGYKNGVNKSDDLQSNVIINALESNKIMTKNHAMTVYPGLESRLKKVIAQNDYDLYKALKDKACKDKEWKYIAIKALIIFEQGNKERDLQIILSILDDRRKHR